VAATLDDVRKLREDDDALFDKVQQVHKGVSTVGQKVKDLHDEMTHNFVATRADLKILNSHARMTDVRLEKIETRLDGMDKRFDGMDGRFDGVDARLDGMDARFDGVDARFDGVDARFDGLESKVDQLLGLEGKVDRILGHLGAA